MGLDLSKLQNVKTVAGKTTARCPACAAAGGDAKGDHLVIYPDGGFGCVANPKDKDHTKEIFRHVGLAGAQGSNGKITVRAVHVPTSSVLMDLQGFERLKGAPTPRSQTAAPAGVPVSADTPPPPASAVPPPVDAKDLAKDVDPPPPADWVDLDGKPANGVPPQRSFAGKPLCEFLGVTEEAFHSAEVEPALAKDVR